MTAHKQNEDGTQEIRFDVSRRVHRLMKEVARRQRMFIGAVYEQAAIFYLKNANDSYMGSKHDSQIQQLRKEN